MQLSKPMQMAISKEKADLLKNSAAFSFVFIGYLLGVWMLFSEEWLINIAGVSFLTAL